MVALDTDGIVELARSFDGLYFETGQGSAVTNGSAEGVDMVTLEARAYGVARAIQRRTGAWMIVNDVAGFIGPEVFRTPEQLLRACLEDLVMATLHGITMGLDVCATFHMGISPSELRALTSQIVRRGAPAYLMAVAGNADPMLGYLTTSFRQHPVIQRETKRAVSPAMTQRLSALNVPADGRPTLDCVADLYARYRRSTGEQRSIAMLAAEGRTKIGELQERGFDIALDAASSDARADRLYEHARQALYATISEAVLRDVCPERVHVKSRAAGRDDFIAHPPAGERITEPDLAALRRLPATHRGPVQIAISDGLNADAISEQLRLLLPPLRRVLADAGHRVAQTVVVVENGRVRAGYDLARALDPDVLIHVIGERPGTGLNTASAYVTYGRDEAGVSRWDPHLDHSHTTAVCGIHPRGKPPEAAAAEIGRAVRRIFEQRRSGVSLR